MNAWAVMTHFCVCFCLIHHTEKPIQLKQCRFELMKRSYCHSLKEAEISPVAVLTSRHFLFCLHVHHTSGRILTTICWDVNVSSQFAILSVCVCVWVGGRVLASVRTVIIIWMLWGFWSIYKATLWILTLLTGIKCSLSHQASHCGM